MYEVSPETNTTQVVHKLCALASRCDRVSTLISTLSPDAVLLPWSVALICFTFHKACSLLTFGRVWSSRSQECFVVRMSVFYKNSFQFSWMISLDLGILKKCGIRKRGKEELCPWSIYSVAYQLVSIVVDNVVPVVGVHAVGHHEPCHPLSSVATTLCHHSCHLRHRKQGLLTGLFNISLCHNRLV